MPWRGILMIRLAGAQHSPGVHPKARPGWCLEKECHRLRGLGICFYHVLASVIVFCGTRPRLPEPCHVVDLSSLSFVFLKKILRSVHHNGGNREPRLIGIIENGINVRLPSLHIARYTQDFLVCLKICHFVVKLRDEGYSLVALYILLFINDGQLASSKQCYARRVCSISY